MHMTITKGEQKRIVQDQNHNTQTLLPTNKERKEEVQLLITYLFKYVSQSKALPPHC